MKHMARILGQGLQYFPLDVRIFTDEKILDINADFGYAGEMVFIRLLTMIYANGYYLESTIRSLAIAISRSIGVESPARDKIEAIITKCGKLGLFDQKLLESGVITSKSIQKQFILSTRRRKTTTYVKYWLLDQKTMLELELFYKTSKSVNVYNNGVNVDNYPLNVDINSLNVDKSTQRKRNKENDKKDKEDKGVYGLPKLHFLTQSLIRNKYIETTDLELMKYNLIFEEVIAEYGFEDTLSVVDYLMKYSKRATTPIDDKFSFLRESLFRNLKMFRNREEFRNEPFEAWIKRTLL